MIINFYSDDLQNTNLNVIHCDDHVHQMKIMFFSLNLIWDGKGDGKGVNIKLFAFVMLYSIYGKDWGNGNDQYFASTNFYMSEILFH